MNCQEEVGHVARNASLDQKSVDQFEPIISATTKQEMVLKQQNTNPRIVEQAPVAKSILKPPSVNSGPNSNYLSSQSGNTGLNTHSVRREPSTQRSPLYEFRQKGSKYRPLFEMFLCYGQEEFFECKDPTFNIPLNFSDMLEQRHRRLTREEQKQELQAQLEKRASGETFSTEAVTRLKNGEQLVGVPTDDRDLDRLDEGPMDQSSFAIGLGETRLGESRIDDLAAAYEASLTPDSLIETRRAIRFTRLSMQAKGRTGSLKTPMSGQHTTATTPAKSAQAVDPEMIFTTSAQQEVENTKSAAKASARKSPNRMTRGTIGGGVSHLVEASPAAQ